MFKRINQNAIAEAIQSDFELKRAILEGLKYKRSHGLIFLFLTALLVIGIAIEGVDSIATPIGVISVFAILVNLSSAAANNSRLELLEAIKTLKVSTNKTSKPENSEQT